MNLSENHDVQQHDQQLLDYIMYVATERFEKDVKSYENSKHINGMLPEDYACRFTQIYQSQLMTTITKAYDNRLSSLSYPVIPIFDSTVPLIHTNLDDHDHGESTVLEMLVGSNKAIDFFDSLRPAFNNDCLQANYTNVKYVLPKLLETDLTTQRWHELMHFGGKELVLLTDTQYKFKALKSLKDSLNDAIKIAQQDTVDLIVMLTFLKPFLNFY